MIGPARVPSTVGTLQPPRALQPAPFDSLWQHGDVLVSQDEVAPRQLRTACDPYAGGRHDLAGGLAPGDSEISAGQVVAILRQINAQSLGEPARTLAETRLPAAAPDHQRAAVEGMESPDQDGAPHSFPFADHVEQAMHPVGEVDVGEARPAKNRAVAHRRAHEGVPGRVLRTISLGLDDDARGYAFSGLVDQDAAQKVDRDLAGVAVIEICIHGSLL